MTVRGFQGASRTWERGWAAARPFRWFATHFPTRKGRGRLIWVLARLFVDRRSGPHAVMLGVPTGGELAIDGATDIGRAAIAQGQFESAEVALLTSCCVAGTVAIDVGANVGLFTIAFAQAVGPAGRVLAIEPYPPSVARLAKNIDRNGLSNITIVPMAVGSIAGFGRLVGVDPAMIRVEPETAISAASVQVTTLDALWVDLGTPEVSVMKIDVEGSEVEVLEGASAVLKSGPTVMVETRTPDEFARTLALLASHGYTLQRAHLEPWNHLFRPGESG